jgi:photosystem II stability/assembly factor-like uncharacterized protein
MLAPTLRFLTLLVCFAAGAAGIHPATAQTAEGFTFDAASFGPLRWRNIGPERAGRSIASAGTAARPFEYYAGFAGGGLWKTVDGGTSWRPVTDGWIGSSSVGAVAVSESDPDVVYLGTGESQIQRNSLQGDGIWGSRDGGATWTHLGFEESQVVARIRVHPTNPDVVFAAVLGHPWGPSAERGIYRSRDGGLSWQRVLDRGDRAGGVDLVIHPTEPDVVWAALWGVRVLPGGGTVAEPGSGLFRSDDGGDSWTELTSNPGMPESEVGKIGVTASAADPERVYALVEAEDGGVFRSEDRGATWTRVNDQGGLRQRPPYFNRIVADPNDADVVYVLNLQLYRSADGGVTYDIVRPPHVDHHDLWIAPGDSRRMISSNDGGPTVTVTGGDSWTAQTMSTAQIYTVTTTRDVPYHVCGPQQDEAAICVPSGQARWRSTSPYVGSGDLGGPLYAPGGGEFGSLAAHPDDPELFYATGPNVITRYDRRTALAQARDIQVAPLSSRGAGADRFTPFAPLLFSRTDPGVVYAGSQRLWRLDTSTLGWTRMSDDLTRGGTGDGTLDSGSAILSIGPSAHDGETVWVGTSDGLVHLTRDGGATWRDVTPPGLPSGAKVGEVEASAHAPASAYVAATGYEIDDRGVYLFRTSDYGATWRSIVDGFGPDDLVHVVREDPVRPGLLYAGTEHGVRISFDDGAHWQSLALNMPDVTVSDMRIEGSDLVISTQGRGFWVLEGIGPLREVSAEALGEPLHVFDPPRVVRRLTPAVIDYHLAADAASVRIDILDASGAVVRTYAGTPPGSAGFHRFTWDQRYEAATVFPGMILWVGTADGPFAPPGRYGVRVTADGREQMRDLEIVRDPLATDVGDADVRAQFELALAARDRIADANEGVLLVRDLRDQIESRLAQATTRGATGGGVTDAGQSLVAALSAVEEQLYQVRLRSQLDAIVHPIRLNNRLANLKLSVETGDGRPTPQHYAAYEQLAGEVAASLATLDGLLGSSLADLNRRLTAAGLDPVRAGSG